jgi:hypothetical protein
MVYDKNIAQLFLLNFNEAYRSAKLLMISYKRVKNLIPLDAEKLKNLDDDDMDKLDAFRVRYCDLQDNMGNKTFRSLLMLEEESTGSNLDIFNKMEKRGIIQSFEDWKKLRNIRNLFSHDYPETEEEKAETLNSAFSGTLNLVETLDNIIRYMEKQLNFPMKSFPILLQKRG